MDRHRTLVFRSVVVAVCVLALPTLASAQVAAEEDPTASARMRVGPFYLTPAVTLSNLGVDSNVFNQSGDPQSDFTFSVAPEADVWVPFARRALLQFTAILGLDYFLEFDSERSVNPDIDGRGEVYFNRLTLFAEASYLNTRQRPSFEIDVRSRRTEDLVGGGFEIRTFRKLYFEVSGRRARTRYDADAFFDGTSLQETLNRRTTSASVAGKYRWTSLTAFVVRGTAAADRFIYSPGRDADSVSGTVGVELRPRALLSGSGYVGVRSFSAQSETVPDYRGLIALASISYILRGSTTFSFTADRDTAYSYEQTQPYYIRDGYGLTIRRQLAGRFDATVGATRYEYAYRGLRALAPGGPVPVEPVVERQDVTWNYTASIGYRPSRDTRIAIGASYYDRQSNTRGSRDYSGFRAGLLVEYGTR